MEAYLGKRYQRTEQSLHLADLVESICSKLQVPLTYPHCAAVEGIAKSNSQNTHKRRGDQANYSFGVRDNNKKTYQKSATKQQNTLRETHSNLHSTYKYSRRKNQTQTQTSPQWKRWNHQQNPSYKPMTNQFPLENQRDMRHSHKSLNALRHSRKAAETTRNESKLSRNRSHTYCHWHQSDGVAMKKILYESEDPEAIVKPSSYKISYDNEYKKHEALYEAQPRSSIFVESKIKRQIDYDRYR